MKKPLPLRFVAFRCLALGWAASVVAVHPAPAQSNQQKLTQQRFEQPYTLHVGVKGLALSHNGKFAAYFDDKQNVVVLDLSTRRILWKQDRMQFRLSQLVVSSDGQFIAGVGRKRNPNISKGERLHMVCIMNTQTRKVLQVPGYAQPLAFSPDSILLIAAGLSGNGLAAYNVKTRKIHALRKEPLTDFMIMGCQHA